MVKKYNDFLNEKLSDKLSGFNEEGLKQQFLNGDIAMLKFLDTCIDYKTDVFMDDDVLCEYNDDFYIPTILYASIKVGSLRGIKYVIESGEYDIDVNDNQILKTAISNNNLDIVKYAIEEQNVDPNLNNNYPLRIAIINKNFEIVKYLVKHGAKINEDSIILANSINDKQIIEFLKNNK